MPPGECYCFYKFQSLINNSVKTMMIQSEWQPSSERASHLALHVYCFICNMMSSSALCFLFLPDLSLDLEFDCINILPLTKNIWIR